MKIGIDNGHGLGCPNGSPDGRLMEYAWTREIASEVAAQLISKGYDVFMVTPEQADIGINKRVARVNKMCNLYGKENVIVVSIHADAIGKIKKWHDVKGWSVLVADTASAASRRLAECLFDEAVRQGRPVVQPTATRKYWERDNVGILTRTACPAILTESGYMTHKEECEWLLSGEGKKVCAQIHVDGIIKYLQHLGL